MDVREKLVELLQNAKAAMKSENLSCDIARNMFVVDFMMANGVTVQDFGLVNDMNNGERCNFKHNHGAICGSTNLPCIKCNPGGCNNRKECAE